MIYADLIMQSRPWEQLTAARESDRLAHAYLFHGPPGVGKEAHAIELAAVVNCKRPVTAGACGTCDSCRKMATLQHPDVQIVVPLPRRNPIGKSDPPLKALKPADIEELALQLGRKGSDPYAKIALADAQSILINSVRELRRLAALKSAEGGRRVILIFDAERLNHPGPAAANALLKLLEEPPPDTVIVLVTARPNLLLETLRSRCVALYFPALAADEAASYLTGKFGADRETAMMVVQATAGNLQLARSLLASDPDGNITRLVDELLEGLLQPRPQKWQQLVTDLVSMNRQNKAELGFRLHLLQLWLRDLMLLARVDAAAGLVFEERREELLAQLGRFPQADWGMATGFVEDALSMLERNINPTLVFTNMFLDIRQAMRGREPAEAGVLVRVGHAV